MATKTAHTLSLDAANGANDCTTEIQNVAEQPQEG